MKIVIKQSSNLFLKEKELIAFVWEELFKNKFEF
jgi:hypothetical protein